jgi:hypothetical protein
MDRSRMTAPASSRSSRAWLYAPFLLLLVLALGWTAFWFVVRGRVIDAVDAALAREAGLGRSWSCTDRSVTGFPFRVELRCSTLALASARWGEAVRVQTGPAVAVGQIYTPNLVIAQITGPLQATLPEGRKLDLGWTRLEASLSHAAGGPERVSLVVTAPDAAAPAADELRARAIGVLWASGIHPTHAEAWADLTIERILLDH